MQEHETSTLTTKKIKEPITMANIKKNRWHRIAVVLYSIMHVFAATVLIGCIAYLADGGIDGEGLIMCSIFVGIAYGIVYGARAAYLYIALTPENEETKDRP